MKAKTKVQIRTSAGLVDAPCFHQWKQHIGGMDFEFAMHIAAGHPKGFVAPLAISELETGFDTKSTIRHPKTGAPLTSSNVQGMKAGEVKKVAQAALHNLIHKRIGAGRFLQAMLGAQMQLSKIDLSKYAVGGTGTETFRDQEALDKLRGGLAQPGVATMTGTATPEQVAILDQMFGTCQVCNGSKVVSTTDVDHEGNHIEITCPACIPKAIELPETPVAKMAGGVGFRSDAAMTPGDPAAEEYIPSPEEAAAAMADAEQMNRNLAKYGTIDSPPTTASDWGSPSEEEWYEGLEPANKLEYLRSKLAERQAYSKELSAKATKADYDRIDDIDNECRDLEEKLKALEASITGMADDSLNTLKASRDALQQRADQHGTMTGDTTEQDYEALAGEIADLDDKISDLEGTPCSK